MPTQLLTTGTVTTHRPAQPTRAQASRAQASRGRASRGRASRSWPTVLGVVAVVALLNVLLIGVTDALADDGSPPTEGDGPAELQIYNGGPASTHDLPSVVYIEAGDAACTGTVIDAEWVLTAAHCLPDRRPDEVLVAVGGDRFAAGFLQVIEAAEVHLHPDFDLAVFDHDIALVQLAIPAEVPVQRLAAADASDPVGQLATIAGYGLVQSDPSPVQSEGLRRAEVPVLDDAICSQVHGADYVPDTSVCAGGEGRDACEGDSGGPLVVAEDGVSVQYGVAAFGDPCGVRSTTVGAWTAVGAYRDWIEGHTGELGGEDPPPEEQPAGPFTDIAGSTHEDAILAVNRAEVAGGYPDGTFRPQRAVTRGQMAAFLARTLDLDPDAVAEPSDAFDDIEGTTHQDAILAVADAEVASGFGDGTYRPDATVTRGQMAAFLMRGLQLGGVDGDVEEPAFPDVAGTTHAQAVSAIVQAGITGGFADGTYRPADEVTRGQMATFLARALGLPTDGTEVGGTD